jgi:hypothetical protein
MSALRKKPVRVIRGAGNKSKWSPQQGYVQRMPDMYARILICLPSYRYDGLYLVSNVRQRSHARAELLANTAT